jgi:glutamyl-tRNA reductase
MSENYQGYDNHRIVELERRVKELEELRSQLAAEKERADAAEAKIFTDNLKFNGFVTIYRAKIQSLEQSKEDYRDRWLNALKDNPRETFVQFIKRVLLAPAAEEGVSDGK